MPQRCIGTRPQCSGPSDSPLVGVQVQVSKDTSLFKWMPHGEGTNHKAFLAMTSGSEYKIHITVHAAQVTFLCRLTAAGIQLIETIRLSPRPFTPCLCGPGPWVMPMRSSVLSTRVRPSGTYAFYCRWVGPCPPWLLV